MLIQNGIDKSMKRLFDFTTSYIGLLFASPVILFCMLFIWLEDFHSPLYIANRVGLFGTVFRMIKLRSMVKEAEITGVDSTSNSDDRLTHVGQLIRRYKLDELSQLWNVFRGDMSIVGPRPNVCRETALYTKKEKQILNVQPGITDLASIVFADEGDVLEGSEDPDIRYNQLVRPWKSRLSLFYVKNQCFRLDLMIVFFTAVGIVSRSLALKGVQRILADFGANQKILDIALRDKPLEPYPPPGSEQIILRRE
jgi:lipopolysaccharide/colanic/teichoic acid biosynthesis glycosyltransferase